MENYYTMKIILFPIFICCMTLSSMAQEAYESKIKWAKTDVACVAIDMNFPPSTVEDVLESRFKKENLKSKSEDGFELFRAVKFPTFSTDKMIDILYKVEKKDKDKEKSRIFMMVSYGNNNFISSKEDELLIKNVKDFLNNFSSVVNKYILEQKIEEQKEVVAKSEKKYINLQDDQKSLEKQRDDLIKKLEENAKDQVAQKEDIAKQKETLESLVTELSKYK